MELHLSRWYDTRPTLPVFFPEEIAIYHRKLM